MRSRKKNKFLVDEVSSHEKFRQQKSKTADFIQAESFSRWKETFLLPVGERAFLSFSIYLPIALLNLGNVELVSNSTFGHKLLLQAAGNLTSRKNSPHNERRKIGIDQFRFFLSSLLFTYIMKVDEEERETLNDAGWHDRFEKNFHFLAGEKMNQEEFKLTEIDSMLRPLVKIWLCWGWKGRQNSKKLRWKEILYHWMSSKIKSHLNSRQSWRFKVTFSISKQSQLTIETDEG